MEATPVHRGMNHTRLDLSEELGLNQHPAGLGLKMRSVPVRASKNGALALGVPSPYEPVPIQYPHTVIFLSESVNLRFFRYLVDIKPARPVASTR
jgi:hypothetical protein